MKSKHLIWIGTSLAATTGIIRFFSTFKITKEKRVVYNPKRWPRPDITREIKKIVIKRRRKA